MTDPVALVMAGGGGVRMRRSGIDQPKPLVAVGGRPLLELNVGCLLHWGLLDVVVSVPADEPRILALCRDRLGPMTAAAGGRLEVLLEQQPLGNIGCAGLLAHRGSPVVVTFADNLTTLDLPDLVAFHERHEADLTLACHDHLFPIPYGRLALRGDRVESYEEKPSLSVTVASAVSVLGPRALAALPADRPTGLVDLTGDLLAGGAAVAAYRHRAAWVDVNERQSLVAAEELVAAHRWLFPDVAS